MIATLAAMQIAWLAGSLQPSGPSAPEFTQDPRFGPSFPICGIEGRLPFIELSSGIFRQGATISVRAMRDNAPAGTYPLPPRCVSDWKITGPARLHEDHSGFAIDPNARPGEEIIVSFKLGERLAEHRALVVARDAVVLTGTRRQTGVSGCEGAAQVGELEFGPNHFAVTFQPFETYKDYWGTYTFDAASGALRLTVTGGNNVPPNLDLEGTARVENGHVVLDDVFLGNPRVSAPPRGACKYVF